MMKDVALVGLSTTYFLNLGILMATALLLLFTRIPAPVIVFLCLFLGWLF